MKFGPVPTAAAERATLAHSVATPEGRLRKGTVLGPDEVRRLATAGVRDVIVAMPEPGDLDENDSAAMVAAALESDGLERRAPFTGRCNIHAAGSGVLEVDRARIDALNRITPDVTVATLPEWQRVAAGTMVATVKVVTFFADERLFAPHLDAAAGALRLRRPVVAEAELIVTELPGAADGAEAVTARLDRLGIAHRVTRVPHEMAALRTALERGGAELRLILTASATSDPRDVGPAALVAAGGRLERFGMPVDPGNLLFLGELGTATVIGLPGCARSPALNGADWVLERVVCGVPIGAAEIAAMGVGGLLGEIPTRPQPRDRARR